jgi:hypothetical protein
MKTLRFEGYSDDTFGEYACTRVDHDNCAKDEPIVFEVRSGDERAHVVGFYAPKGTSQPCWLIGLQMADEGVLIPAWPIRTVRGGRPYTFGLEMDVPDDATVTHVKSETT